MKKSFLGLALLTVLALSGCGNGNDNRNDQFGGGVGVGGQGGACPPQVVDAYNQFASQCNQAPGMQQYSQASGCQSAAANFLQNFGDVSCMAEIQGGGNGNGYGSQYGGQYGGQYGSGGGQAAFRYNQGNGYNYNTQYDVQYQGQQMMQISSAPMRQVLGMLDQFRGGNRNWNNGYQRWHNVRRR